MESNNRSISSEMTGGRMAPQALEAERAILGALLQFPTSIDRALDEKLYGTDFYLEKHAYIYEAIKVLANDGKPIDVISVVDELQKKPEAWALIQDQAFLWQLTEEVSSAAHIGHHATIVKQKSLLRDLILMSNRVIQDAMDPSVEPQKTLQEAEKYMFSISEDRTKGDVLPVSTVMAETMKMINSYSDKGVSGVPTGFTDLDSVTSGLQPGDFIVLAGRPAMGKTAFALSLLANTAIQHQKSTVFFSLEMPGEQLLQRVLCSQAQVDMSALRKGMLPKNEYPKLSMAASPISEAPIFIDDNASLSLLDLKSKCRMLKKRHGLDLIIIDYLQLMDGPGENRQVQIATISRGLKELAKELRCPVIALSQLSRAVEQRTGDGKPMISDLRESGAIEQDADMVWFVYRKHVYDPSAHENDGQLIIAKHRNGPLADINLTFIGSHAAFYNRSHRDDEHFGYE